MHVVATAGHVDHGKSRLVRALTGIDPDRLQEEKRRGLTIDLGFAWVRLPSGREVGVVDVPGHERFIKNMLAGVGAINATLFVVAANEAWQPQSQEHLDILDLLGVEAGVVAITKIDTVDQETHESVLADVESRLAKTSLAGSELIPVSAEDGRGLGELLEALDRLLQATPAAEDTERPRLWIDRVFTISGAGTVVTGTLTGGSLGRGDELVILPQGVPARIRGVQSHRKQVDRIGPGNRTALNLVGPAREDIARGDTAVLPGMWRPTSTLLVDLEFLRHLDHQPAEKGAYKFYLGSTEQSARVRFVDGQDGRVRVVDGPNSAPENSVIALLRLDSLVVADFRDHFVLRESGRQMTIGGGVILEPHVVTGDRAALLAAAEKRIAASSRQDYLQILVDEEGQIRKDEIRLRSGLSPANAPSVGRVELPSVWISEKRFEELAGNLEAMLAEHHAGRPLEPGISLADARARVELDTRTFQELVEKLVALRRVDTDLEHLRLPNHAARVSGQEAVAVVGVLLDATPAVPTFSELSAQFDPDLIRALIRSGELVQVSTELVYPASWIADLKRRVKALAETRGPFTVADFRDDLGTTRKYAVPLLEYLDQKGVTRRQGDRRVVLS